jgi:hypothetical protein
MFENLALFRIPRYPASLEPGRATKNNNMVRESRAEESSLDAVALAQGVVSETHALNFNAHARQRQFR